MTSHQNFLVSCLRERESFIVMVRWIYYSLVKLLISDLIRRSRSLASTIDTWQNLSDATIFKSPIVKLAWAYYQGKCQTNRMFDTKDVTTLTSEVWIRANKIMPTSPCVCYVNRCVNPYIRKSRPYYQLPRILLTIFASTLNNHQFTWQWDHCYIYRERDWRFVFV